jgi:hypothetical protein
MSNYTATVWVDDVPPGTGTPLNATNMNKLEGGAAASLPRSSVFAGEMIPYQNFLQPSDAQPAFRFSGNGKLEWGAGGSFVLDTALYRSAAATLKTEGVFVVTGILAFQ